MGRIRLIMIGGFLGAGKTTTIARLATMYQNRGRTVGILTNDQGIDLVDTQAFRSRGFAVGEVTGACFCCSFADLVRSAETLHEIDHPDVILAEPVGSCTDLVATVIRPLIHLFGHRFDVAPYGVLLKPNHGCRILLGKAAIGFSPKAGYIFKKQLEEADFILCNRIDELTSNVIENLTQALNRNHPDTPVLRISARTGEGFDALQQWLEQPGTLDRRTLNLDYNIYAEGEAELGWLNASAEVKSDQPWFPDNLLVEFLDCLRTTLKDYQAEAAHVKVMGIGEGFHAVANLTSTEGPVELSLPSHCLTHHADVIVNARVAMEPELLERSVRAALRIACRRHETRGKFKNVACFRPSRPKPTHRLSENLND